jgi:fructose-specific phosphotransferase system IIA component
MALVDLVLREIVKVPLESTSKPAVLRELVQVLKEAGRIADAESALSAVNQREQMGSTGLELGIAVPHAKTDTVKTLTLAIGISPQGIDFSSLDGKPSKLFFLMLAPPNQSGPHIQALADIAKLSRVRSLCDALMSARSAEEVVRLFKDE